MIRVEKEGEYREEETHRTTEWVNCVRENGSMGNNGEDKKREGGLFSNIANVLILQETNVTLLDIKATGLWWGSPK